MKLVAVSAITLSFLAVQPVNAHWDKTKWGMTPAQVEKAMKGAAPLGGGVEDEERGNYVIGNVGSFTMGDVKLRTVFHYLEGKLVLVDLKLDDPKKKCDTLKAQFVKKYGKPTEEKSDSVEISARWVDKKSKDNIFWNSHMYGCNVAIYPTT